MKKSLIIAAVVLIAIIIGVCIYKKWESDTELKSDAPNVFSVRRGNIRVKVEAEGSIAPELELEVKSKASGDIINLPVDTSDIVKKGDLLAQLNTVDMQRQLDQTQANLDISIAQKKQADINLSSAEKRLPITKRKLSASLTTALAQLKQSELALSNSEKTLEINRTKYQSNLSSANLAADAAIKKLERTNELFSKNLASIEERDTQALAAAQAKTSLQTAQSAMDELDVSEHDLETKRLAVETAKANLEMVQAQFDDIAIQESELDQLRQAIAIAEAKIVTNQIELLNSKERLVETSVIAPMDGVITKRNVQIGSIIASGTSNVSGGTTILLLADLTHIYLMAAIDESDIGVIKVGQKASVSLDAFPEQTFEGNIIRIGTKGTTMSDVVTFETKIEIVSANRSLLKPDMTGDVRIVAAEKDNVLVVPINAVKEKQGKKYVQISSKDDLPQYRDVEIGLSDGEFLEIISGLSENEQIINSTEADSGKWKNEKREHMGPF